jgi:3',5'-cyclic AMP phosphodiesterase CpdA
VISGEVALGGRLLGISDVHVANPENREVVEGLRAGSDSDWLIVAGDFAEVVSEIEWALRVLRDRFHTVIWVPGNHELWTLPQDSVTLRGQARYQHLVDLCRRLGVFTPEGSLPSVAGSGRPSSDRAIVSAL